MKHIEKKIKGKQEVVVYVFPSVEKSILFPLFYFDNIARKVLHSNEHNMCAINSYESTFIQAAVK